MILLCFFNVDVVAAVAVAAADVSCTCISDLYPVSFLSFVWFRSASLNIILIGSVTIVLEVLYVLRTSAVHINHSTVYSKNIKNKRAP